MHDIYCVKIPVFEKKKFDNLIRYEIYSNDLSSNNICYFIIKKSFIIETQNICT